MRDRTCQKDRGRVQSRVTEISASMIPIRTIRRALDLTTTSGHRHLPPKRHTKRVMIW